MRINAGTEKRPCLFSRELSEKEERDVPQVMIGSTPSSREILNGHVKSHGPLGTAQRNILRGVDWRGGANSGLAKKKSG